MSTRDTLDFSDPKFSLEILRLSGTFTKRRWQKRCDSILFHFLVMHLHLLLCRSVFFCQVYPRIDYRTITGVEAETFPEIVRRLLRNNLASVVVCRFRMVSRMFNYIHAWMLMFEKLYFLFNLRTIHFRMKHRNVSMFFLWNIEKIWRKKHGWRPVWRDFSQSQRPFSFQRLSKLAFKWGTVGNYCRQQEVKGFFLHSAELLHLTWWFFWGVPLKLSRGIFMDSKESEGPKPSVKGPHFWDLVFSGTFGDHGECEVSNLWPGPAQGNLHGSLGVQTLNDRQGCEVVTLQESVYRNWILLPPSQDAIVTTGEYETFPYNYFKPSFFYCNWLGGYRSNW